MFGSFVVLFMIVGFALCGLWAHCANAKQRRAEAAAAALAEANRQRQEEQRRQRAAAKVQRQRQAEAKQKEAEAKKQENAQRREARRQQQEADRAAKLAAAREMAELKERQLAAAREMVKVQMAAYERRGTVSNDDVPVIDDPPQAAQDGAEPVHSVTLDQFAAAYAEAPHDAPKPFQGQAVAFTGRLSMPRREAVEKVRQAGGRAFDKGMPAGTTLLVVGDKPGMCKMDRADEWIGQVRKITEAQFLEMCAKGGVC